MGSLPGFYLKAGVYTVSFLVCYYALNALNFEQFLKPGHEVRQYGTDHLHPRAY